MATVASRVGIPNRPSVKTESWLTRDQARDLLRCSEAMLTHWTKTKLLHPIQEARKVKGGQVRAIWLYDPLELTRLPLRRRGREPAPEDRAPQAFEMFNDGHKPRDVVVATRLDPDRVRDLYEQWLMMGGADVVIAPAAKRDLEAIVGPFEDVAGLVARVRECVPPLPPVAAETAECPADCLMCSGAACNLCDTGPGEPFCDHAVDERHRERPAAT
jgi:hypothetical protein